MTTIYFDVETGGFDPAKHPIIQFAAVAIGDDWQELEAVEAKIQFDPSACSPEALATNHYSPEAWVSAIPEREAVDTLAALFRRHSSIDKTSAAGKLYRVARLAAHNARFDCDFLGALFKRHGAFCPAAIFEPLDTLALARWHLGRRVPSELPNLRLESICSYYRIQLDNAHDALCDVRATAIVARRLLAEMRG